LPLLSQHHSTGLPSAKRNDNRYEDRFLSEESPTLRRFTCR
jgi:hypothetical protein